MYRSNDKGESWAKMTENNDYMERFCGTYGWVMGQIRVNPLDENCLYILGLAMAKSNDGGKTWKRFQPVDTTGDYIHGDNHALWIDPADSNYIINGDDGGIAVTYNGGKKWKNFIRIFQPHNFIISLMTQGFLTISLVLCRMKGHSGEV